MKDITARSIIAEAKKNGIFEGPIPEDSEAAQKEAKVIVDMAKLAWEELVRGPEVVAILKLEASDEKEIEEVPPVEENPRPEEEIADDVREAEEAEETDLSKTEPWDDYDDDKIPAIKETIDVFVASNDQEKSELLLAHVWEYEFSNKNRQRVFAHVNSLKEILDEETSPEKDSTPEAQGEVTETSESDAPTQDSGEQLSSGDSNADVVPEPEDNEPRQEKSITTGTIIASEIAAGSIISDNQIRDYSIMSQEEFEDKLSKISYGGETEKEPEYVELIKDVEDQLERERLHIPAPLPPGDQPEVPFDLNELTDKQLRSLHGAFGAYAYRTGYLLMKEEGKARRCKERADDLHRNFLAVIEKQDEHGKQKVIAVLEAEIESLPEVIKWRKRQRMYELQAHSLRAQRDGYLKEGEILSRQETMRHNDWERGRR